MLVVIEGVDGSGKTTLCEKIREAIKPYFAILRHSQRPKTPEDLTNILSWITYIPDTMDVVIDRYPLISESIYGPVFRQRDLFTESGIDIPYHLNRIDRIVYCRPPMHYIKHNMHVQAQMSGVHDKIDELVTRYDDKMSELAESGIDVVQFDYTTASPAVDKFDYEQLVFGRTSGSKA